jgi:hypothetical protein
MPAFEAQDRFATPLAPPRIQRPHELFNNETLWRDSAVSAPAKLDFGLEPEG